MGQRHLKWIANFFRRIAGAVLRLLWKKRMRSDGDTGDRVSSSTGQIAIEIPLGETAPAVRICGEASMGAPQPQSESCAPDANNVPAPVWPTESVPSDKPCIPTHSDRLAPEPGVTEPRESQDGGPTVSIQVEAGPVSYPHLTLPTKRIV